MAIRWVNPKPFITVDGLEAGAIVEPGASVDFTVTLDPSGLDSGLNTGSVTVISNDPLRPVREVRFALVVND